MIFETRGESFANMPDRVIILSQYQRAWREIWTDDASFPERGLDGKARPIHVITATP